MVVLAIALLSLIVLSSLEYRKTSFKIVFSSPNHGVLYGLGSYDADVALRLLSHSTDRGQPVIHELTSEGYKRHIEHFLHNGAWWAYSQVTHCRSTLLKHGAKNGKVGFRGRFLDLLTVTVHVERGLD